MPTSKIEICNSALSKIGAAAIQSIDEDSREATACKLRYDQCKRVVLRKHPWNCASDRVSLAPTTTTPAFDYQYQFQLPSNCLRVLNVDASATDEPEYAVEKRFLLSDETALDVKFIFDCGEEVMDDLLSEAVACYLAWDIAYKITQKSEVRDAMWKLYMQALRDAKSVDAQEETGKALTADDFVMARLDGSSPGRSNR